MRPGTSDIFKHVHGGRSGTERVFATNMTSFLKHDKAGKAGH